MCSTRQKTNDESSFSCFYCWPWSSLFVILKNFIHLMVEFGRKYIGRRYYYNMLRNDAWQDKAFLWLMISWDYYFHNKNDSSPTRSQSRLGTEQTMIFVLTILWFVMVQQHSLVKALQHDFSNGIGCGIANEIKTTRSADISTAEDCQLNVRFVNKVIRCKWLVISIFWKWNAPKMFSH